MAGKKEEGLIRKSRKYSIVEGASASVAGGAGESYISAFAVSLNATNSQIAFLTSIPGLIAPFSQLFLLRRMEKGSRKSLVLRGVLLQAIMWLPMLILALLYFYTKTSLAPLLLVTLFTIYTVFGSSVSGVWVSWIGDLVKGKQGAYFGRRNRIATFVSLCATLIAGFFLDFFSKEFVLIGFAVLFFISFVSRLVSRYYLGKQYEPKLKFERGYYFSLLQFLRRIREEKNNFGKFVIYVCLMILATNIAAPFFTPYMLRDLHFSYLEFIIIGTLISALVTAAVLPLWGRFADKYGNIKMLKICAFIVPWTPFLWVISQNIYWLGAIQVVSGVGWAGFNLAASNYLYDIVTPQRRGLCFAYQSILNGVSVFIGASIGGLIAGLPAGILGMNILLFIFLISSIVRVLISIIFVNKLKEVRSVQDFKFRKAGRIQHKLYKLIHLR
jgi:MFS family permease